MKVTMLSNSKGGVLSFTIGLVQYLAAQGCDINVFFLTQSEETRCLEDSERLRFDYFIASRFLPNLRALARFFFFDRPSVVHINFASFGPLAYLKKLVFKRPFIFTVHGLPQPWLEPSTTQKFKYIVESLLLPFTASQAAVRVAVSAYVRNRMKAECGLDSEVIHNGVAANRFKRKDKKESMKRLGCNEAAKIVLFVGNLHPYKDPLTLISAFARAVNKNDNLHLIMIGTGKLRRQVENEVERLKLSGHVKLMGHATEEDLRLCYGAADLFVLPSVNEAFGIVLLEAMASGLPIIAADSGACPEIVGNAGILFRQGDSVDLAEKIAGTIQDEELMERLSNEGLRRIRLFSWQDIASKYMKLYENVAGVSK